ncbi:MAG: histidine phosphatase family protein [Hyphomicrobiales bacterium]|nr:histidine phosphatase family protein [Hyphomicrobiales bacterium]
MKTVSLFRHAKSSWEDKRLKDFDRPLAPRGEKAAERMGAYMAAKSVAPDLMLCSSSVRTRATLKLAGKKMVSAKTLHEDALYHASAGAMLTMLRALPPSVAHVMIVGHNPGLHALVLDLFGSGAREEILAAARKFPTAALAQIEFDIAQWRRLGVGDGRLTRFIIPKALAAAKSIKSP